MDRDPEAPPPAPVPPHPRYPAALDVAIWMMPEGDLRAAIDGMASNSEARSDAIGYYLDEWDRRQQARLNTTLVRLTWAITVLTVVVAILTAVSALD